MINKERKEITYLVSDKLYTKSRHTLMCLVPCCRSVKISSVYTEFTSVHVYSKPRVKLETHSCLTAQNQTSNFLPFSWSKSGLPFVSLMWALSYTVEQLQQCIIQLADCNSINFLPPASSTQIIHTLINNRIQYRLFCASTYFHFP